MATINETYAQVKPGVNTITWSSVTESDDANAVIINGLETGLAAMQVTGSFGGATIFLQGSNDGVNWINLSDVSGDVISLTTENGAEFSTGYAYIRPSAGGGTGQSVTVTICFRGN